MKIELRNTLDMNKSVVKECPFMLRWELAHVRWRPIFFYDTESAFYGKELCGRKLDWRS